jgi:hypothetical protein
MIRLRPPGARGLIRVDLWNAAPTSSKGDRATWLMATGRRSFGAFTCVMGAEQGDGALSECYPQIGNAVVVKLASGASVFLDA